MVTIYATGQACLRNVLVQLPEWRATLNRMMAYVAHQPAFGSLEEKAGEQR
jgi:hypothetical protein